MGVRKLLTNSRKNLSLRRGCRVRLNRRDSSRLCWNTNKVLSRRPMDQVPTYLTTNITPRIRKPLFVWIPIWVRLMSWRHPCAIPLSVTLTTLTKASTWRETWRVVVRLMRQSEQIWNRLMESFKNYCKRMREMSIKISTRSKWKLVLIAAGHFCPRDFKCIYVVVRKENPWWKD